MKTVEVSALEHKGQHRLAIRFPYYIDELRQKISGLPGRRWSQSQRCWHVPADTPLDLIKTSLEPFLVNFPTRSCPEPSSVDAQNAAIINSQMATRRP